MIYAVDRDTDPEKDEEEAEEEQEEEQEEKTGDMRDYSDYYKMIAQSKTIRPICVSEGVNFNKMSSWTKTCWWVKACLQMLR